MAPNGYVELFRFPIPWVPNISIAAYRDERQYPQGRPDSHPTVVLEKIKKIRVFVEFREMREICTFWQGDLVIAPNMDLAIQIKPLRSSL